MKNIVLLPNTKTHYMKQAYDLFQTGDFAQSVEILELLMDHQVESFEIHMNYVVSLMKLKEWDKAIQSAEDFIVLHNQDKKSQFIELIVMAHFEQGDFPQALKKIDDSLHENLSSDVKKRLETIRLLCQEQNVMTGNVIEEQIIELVANEKHIHLFTTIQKWKQLNITPPNIFYDYLLQPHVHPVIKTIILEEIKKQQTDSEVNIQKFGKHITIVPNHLKSFDQLDYVQALLNAAEEIEHQNPSLSQLMKTLIFHYSYVMYPFDIDGKEHAALFKAFQQLAQQLLSIEEIEEVMDQRISAHIENINICHHLYVSIVGDSATIE